jgi:hypothetical protein
MSAAFLEWAVGFQSSHGMRRNGVSVRSRSCLAVAPLALSFVVGAAVIVGTAQCCLFPGAGFEFSKQVVEFGVAVQE